MELFNITAAIPNVHMHRNPETLTTFFSSGMKRLLTFFDF